MSDAASRLAEVARGALDGWAAAHFPAPPRRADAATMARLRARLDALTGGSARATVAAMPLPTLDAFAASAYASALDSAGAWNTLSAPTKEAVKARMRYTLDYLAGGVGRAAGVIYSASPTDPPPTEPAP